MKHFTPPPNRTWTLIAAALVALVLATPPAMARCNVNDITMQKSWPLGDVARTDTMFISFRVADCPAANPPLKLCVVVWDNSDCRRDAGSLCEVRRPYPQFSSVGNAGASGTGWVKEGYGTLCNSRFREGRTVDGVSTVANPVNLTVDPGTGDPIYDDNNNPRQRHISLVMYNPIRHLVIPIKGDK